MAAPINFIGASSQALAGLAPGVAASSQNVYTPQQYFQTALGAQQANYANYAKGIQSILAAQGQGNAAVARGYPQLAKSINAQQAKALQMQETGNQQILGQYGRLASQTRNDINQILPGELAQIDRNYVNSSGSALQNLVARGGGQPDSTITLAMQRGQQFDRNQLDLQALSQIGGLNAQYGSAIGMARLGAAQQGLGANVGQLNNMAQTQANLGIAGLNYQGQALQGMGQLGITGLGQLAQIGSQFPQYQPMQYGGGGQQPMGGGTTNPNATFNPGGMQYPYGNPSAGNYGTEISGNNGSLSSIAQAALGGGGRTPPFTGYNVSDAIINPGANTSEPSLNEQFSGLGMFEGGGGGEG